ncbi:single-stranded DNA-binding protein [Microbacterium rhizosphaerae]|uniref:Single-stranded DNA-binding protein n=1 Tax=Microbacterium rhizosphaerae TaxID=1678237 RepID=A0ABZ0STW8_9MICO|nr:single-stranded DNA-binding protein [Microbacterium rhizosphaerae]WPR91293.1 single-stranded DNA-binding protein [Microbacterium rhizosphaerae]
MALHTQQSISGFIASDPQQTVTESGDTRLYVRIGQPTFRRNDDGTFTELEPTFHDMVAYRATAERALTRLAKGDSFIAEGYTRKFTIERDGQAIETEEFVAKKLGHDLARTNYEVDRSRRRQAPERDATTRTTVAKESAATTTGMGI